jgi:hypothetical protein
LDSYPQLTYLTGIVRGTSRVYCAFSFHRAEHSKAAGHPEADGFALSPPERRVAGAILETHRAGVSNRRVNL